MLSFSSKDLIEERQILHTTNCRYCGAASCSEAVLKFTARPFATTRARRQRCRSNHQFVTPVASEAAACITRQISGVFVPSISRSAACSAKSLEQTSPTGRSLTRNWSPTTPKLTGKSEYPVRRAHLTHLARNRFRCRRCRYSRPAFCSNAGRRNSECTRSLSRWPSCRSHIMAGPLVSAVGTACITAVRSAPNHQHWLR